MPARIAKRGNKQIGADSVAADLDQALAKVDLHLLAWRRLKAHRCSRFRLQLLPVRLHCPLHRPKAGDDSLLGRQLLADYVGIAAMATQPLPQPPLQPVEHLFARRLPIRRPAARRDVILHCVAANPKFSGNPFGAPPQLVQRGHDRLPPADVSRLAAVHPEACARSTECDRH